MTTIDTQHSTQESAGPDGPGTAITGVPTEDFLIESYLQPASIKAISHLAQDTIAATSGLPNLRDEPGSLAMFQNPYSGFEEILYVDYKDNSGSLMWVRKTDLAQATGTPVNTGGWSIELAADEVESVAVVVHPNGSVYAFCTTGTSLLAGDLLVLQLFQKSTGTLEWIAVPVDPNGTEHKFQPSQLFVQYLNDRAATPVVFAVDITQFTSPEAFIIAPAVEGQAAQNAAWQFRWSMSISKDDIAGLGAMGVDDNHMLTARAYSRHPDGTLWRTVATPSWGQPPSFWLRTQIDIGWQSIGGVWTSHDGAGCVGLSSDGRSIVYTQPNVGQSVDGFISGGIRLDRKCDAVNVWSDSSALLHVYGRIATGQPFAGGLCVLHQSGWTWLAETYNSAVPAWETYDAGTPIGFARPLFAAADRFVADPYPDDMPSQLVLSQLETAAESASIFTQQPGTNYWEREVVRFVPKLPENAVALQLVNRYQTKVTVLSSYGSPVPLCSVTLTADGPVDLEVAGKFYRTSETTPLTLTTDLTGSLILRVLAEGLSAPNMHLSVSGVAESLTVQPAADVQKFLGGNGTLPNHREGLSAAGIKAAKNRDGTVLFPALFPKDSEALPPSPDDVFTWFQAAFAASARKPLPPAMRAKLADEEVVAFSLQTHDPGRPACEVYSEAQLDVHRHELREQGLLDDPSEWFGDLVEGLRSGVISASQVVVDVKNRTLDVLVDLTSTGQTWLRGVWDDVVSAAHAVEAMCAALGAKVWQVVEWLTWAFDLEDVWHTKQALEQWFDPESDDSLPKLVKKATALVRENSAGWTTGADKVITDAFIAIRETLGGMTGDTLAGVPPTVTESTPLWAANLLEYFESAPLQWYAGLFDLGTARLPSPPMFKEAFDTAMNGIGNLASYQALQPAVAELLQGLEQIGDPTNPHSMSTIVITTVLDFFEALAHSGVQLADDALGLLLTMTDSIADGIQAFYDTPLDSAFLQGVYEFIQQQAGITTDFEKLTMGRASMLMSAFPVTVVYKTVFGEAPFQLDSPYLPSLPGIGKDPLPPGIQPGVNVPAKWSVLKGWQGYCTIMMVFDAYFDIKINMYSIAKSLSAGIGGYGELGEYWLRGWAFNHFLAYGIGDYPPVWGNDFPPKWDDPYQWGPTITWWMSFVANLADLGCACGYGMFVATFENDKPPHGIGAFMYSGLGMFRLILSGARYHYDPAKDYPFSKWNCAINVSSFFSSATGFFRRALFEQQGQTAVYVVLVKAALDAVCDAFAGIASLVQIGYEDNNPPMISPAIPTPIVARLGRQFSQELAAINGMAPYEWWTQPVETPTPGAIGGLPPGIQLIDGNVGSLDGYPTKTGVYEFWVVVGDYYGPEFYYMSDKPVQIRVTDTPPEDGEPEG